MLTFLVRCTLCYVATLQRSLVLLLLCIQVTVGWGLGGPVSKGVLGIHNPLNVATLDNFAKFGSSKFACRCFVPLRGPSGKRLASGAKFNGSKPVWIVSFPDISHSTALAP